MHPDIATNPSVAREAAAHIAKAIGAEVIPLPAMPAGPNGIPPGRKACRRVKLPGGRVIDCQTWAQVWGVCYQIRADQVQAERLAAARIPPDDRQRIRAYIAANPRRRISEVAAALSVDALLVAKVMGDLRPRG